MIMRERCRLCFWSSLVFGFFLLVNLIHTASASESGQISDAGFAAWVAEFRIDAEQQGVSEATLDTALSDIQLNQKVLKHDAYQPEFTKQVWEYLARAVSASRIKNGREKFAEHEDLLREVAAKYRVAPQLITGIWGLETAYGHTFGGFNVIEALATLGYQGRRAKYGRQQLMAALKIIDSGDIPAEQMQGSWAGAMGHTQFIPTSFQSRAIDYDRDGKRDIWNSYGDVFASTANYMQKAGWRAGETWGAPVALPEEFFDWSLADRSVKKSIAEWESIGITTLTGEPLPQTSGEAWLMLPAGHRGPAFLILPNFHAILKYNNSSSYALAVGMLGDEIIGNSTSELNWPTDIKSLNRRQRKELQRRLTQAGYDTGGVDGILGANSRKALRNWQSDNGLIPDGFATLDQLEILRQ